MITINFRFAGNQKPEIAAEIERNIRQRVIDENLQNTADVIVNLEYEGKGMLHMVMPMNIPIGSNTRILEISDEEIRALISS